MRKIIRFIYSFGVGFGIAMGVFLYLEKKIISPKLAQMQTANDKLLTFYRLLIWWVKNYQDNCLVKDKLKQMGYKRVAIYGIKELGERSYFECLQAGVDVPFFIDKCGLEEILMDKPVPVVNPNNTKIKWNDIDAVIVTAVTYFDEIKAELEPIANCAVVSLEELVFKA